MPQFITEANQITTDWLTEVLAQSEALTKGRVSQVDVRLMETNTASAAPLHLTYSDDATGTKPEKLFLKIGRRYSEASFHQHFAPQMPDLSLVRCYHAAFADERGQSNLLFDDISATHSTPPSALPMPSQTALNLVEILATLHRHWWEHPDLAASGLYANECDDVPNFVLRQVKGQFAEFVDVLGDRLSEKRRRTYERILEALPLPQWTNRIREHRAVTLIHGDAHWWNFVYPHTKDDVIYLLDWAVWHVNTPGHELAYMLTVRCFDDYRQHFESKILRHYHAHLNLSSYDWSQFWDDYRMGVIYHTIWPIFWHKFASPSIWWNALECVMTAFDDLECEEFLN